MISELITRTRTDREIDSIMALYTRTDTGGPLQAYVAVFSEDGTQRRGFQLQPARSLTPKEKEALTAQGKDPSKYVWVGYPVPHDSEPVKWSEEIQTRVKAAMEVLREAAKLGGEVSPEESMWSDWMPHWKFQARHFLATGAGETEEQAEEIAARNMRWYGFTDGCWLRSGHGKPAEHKYSY